MEDFFERIHNLNTEVDLGYIGSEVNRLRAYLYTLRDEDRQREVERLQTDLTYWIFAINRLLDDWKKRLPFEYAKESLGILKREMRIADSEELGRFDVEAQQAKYMGRGLEDLPDKEKAVNIQRLIMGYDLVWWDVARDFFGFGFDFEETEEEEPEAIPQQREIPEELQGEDVLEYLEKAKALGLIDDNYYWNKEHTKAECAIFCACLNVACGIHYRGVVEGKEKKLHLWKPYEVLFYGEVFPSSKGLGNTFRELQNRANRDGVISDYKKISCIFGIDLDSLLG